MTPEQFLDQIKKRGPEPVYLFLGQEGYNRERCRRALVDAFLGTDVEGVTRHELDQLSLAEALDDARALSLFVSKRIIWLGSAEAALPRGKVSEAEDSESNDAGLASLESYLRQPTPDTIVIIDAARFDFDGEDKEKLARVQKYYSAVKSIVEFRAFSPESARALAQSLAKQIGRAHV